jgi:hypothetical protein
MRLALPGDVFWSPARDAYMEVLRTERDGILCRIANGYAVHRVGFAEAIAGSPTWKIAWRDVMEWTQSRGRS